MAAIYEPSGAAREYSPLALNYINGCDHGCVYCYVPKMMKRFNKGYVHSEVYIKEEKKLVNELETSFKKHRNSSKQVFLSFLTDPYSHFNNETKLTRRVLEMLLEYQIPVSILSKGGFNILKDLDVIKQFGENIQIGGSLTFVDKDLSKKWEQNSSDPQERFETLNILHNEGVRTWASMEPVIYPDQSLEIMEITKDYVDAYKIGKLNHFPKHEQKFDWTKFLNDSIRIMRKNNKPFYIKNDLSEWSNEETVLSKEERDMDFLAISNKFEKESQFNFNENTTYA
jgi:DNA repair photolyase